MSVSDRFPVQLIYVGKCFDRGAVLHLLRHAALRFGWVFVPRADHRIVYAVAENPAGFDYGKNSLVIVSHPEVQEFMRSGRGPLPMSVVGGGYFPFVHPASHGRIAEGEVVWADIVAGGLYLLNLEFENRNRKSEGERKWIRFEEDLWTAYGLSQPEPFVDQWLTFLQEQMIQLGWYDRPPRDPEFWAVLSHDIDYFPSSSGRGLPRLLRALARQIVTRRSFGDGIRIFRNYVDDLRGGRLPYDGFSRIVSCEGKHRVTSTFAVVAEGGHKFDPSYVIRENRLLLSHCKRAVDSGWEVCLHGSYLSSGTPGKLALEKRRLECLLGRKVVGHRHHYLNFNPKELFHELESAGFEYDMSVGYNDMIGPRAGTYFPFRPYNFSRSRSFSFWEIPLAVMDTTMATTFKISADMASGLVETELEKAAKCAGAIGINWHHEQFTETLDPGYGWVYEKILQRLAGEPAHLGTGGEMSALMECAWKETSLI